MNPQERDGDDPYELLGLGAVEDRDKLGPADIRAAYRRAALRHHPDRQRGGTERDRRAANELFARISAAYEVLGDPERRRRYDLQRRGVHDGNYLDRDRFFFRDPFAVFEQVFREEFGGGGGGMDAWGEPRGNSVMDDFFFSMRPFGGFGGRDPFGGGFGGGGGGGLFGGVGGRDPFAGDPFGGGESQYPYGGVQRRDPYYQQRRDPFQDMFSSMRQMQQQMQQHQQSGGGGGGGGNGMYYSSSSTTTSTIQNGEQKSVTKTTRHVNGKEQTVVETITRKADGTVDRHVDVQSDEDFPAQYRIERGQEEQEQQPPQFALPPATDEERERRNSKKPAGLKRLFGGRHKNRKHRGDGGGGGDDFDDDDDDHNRGSRL